MVIRANIFRKRRVTNVDKAMHRMPGASTSASTITEGTENRSDRTVRIESPVHRQRKKQDQCIHSEAPQDMK